MAAVGGGAPGPGSSGGSAHSGPPWWVLIVITAFVTSLFSSFSTVAISNYQDDKRLRERQTDSLAAYTSESERYLRIAQGLQMCDVMAGKSTDDVTLVNEQAQKLFGTFGAAQISIGGVENDAVVDAFSNVYTATIHMNSVLSVERTYVGDSQNLQTACNEAQENFDTAFVRLNSAQSSLSQVVKEL